MRYVKSGRKFDATEQEVMPYFEKVESLLHEMESLISEENK